MISKLRRFAHCFGVKDRCHIPIKCPSGDQVSAKEYRKFQNFYSLVLMAIVDIKYCFLSDNCGIPGNSHDSEILEASELYWQIIEQHYTQYRKHWRQHVITPLIVGDSAFPFCTWFLKPCTNAILTREQSYFNYCLSRARMATASFLLL